jgi:malic enzyme
LTEQLAEHDVHAIPTGKGISKIFSAGFKFGQRSKWVSLTSDGSAVVGVGRVGITATVIQ